MSMKATNHLKMNIKALCLPYFYRVFLVLLAMMDLMDSLAQLAHLGPLAPLALAE